MTLFADTLLKVQQQLPKIKIKYKDQSILMKILGRVLFFDPSFMKSYTTTIGNSVYYPSENFVKITPVSSSIILIHESIHIRDADSLTHPLFFFLYLFPQILFPILAAILFLLFGWKIALFSLLFLLPFPAYFRMQFEKKAYTFSLFAMYKLSEKYNYKIDLMKQNDFILDQFNSSYYYYMWTIPGLDNYFSNVVNDIQNGKYPEYNIETYQMIEKCI